MTLLPKSGRTPLSHAMLCWLRSNGPFANGFLLTLLIAGLFGIAGIP